MKPLSPRAPQSRGSFVRPYTNVFIFHNSHKRKNYGALIIVCVVALLGYISERKERNVYRLP